MEDKYKVSKSALELRKTIENAIQYHEITHHDYELMMEIAYEDGILDSQERALLEELEKMIESNHIKIVHNKDCKDSCIYKK